ncbi:MAG: hydroxymethylbilane synthase [Eubacteriaceae bacterium]|nr:hydroxymethylbilane synthase [Eubacteriaceae bacterium]
MKKHIRIGSRESQLAVVQANIAMAAISSKYPQITFELVTIKTTGDRILDKTLDAIGGKGLFIKEIEQALLDGAIDLAVHSYKDMPYEQTPGLPIVALSEREAPFDALVLPKGSSKLDKSKPVGSASIRRKVQFEQLYEGYSIAPVRGNVQTRLKKLDSGEFCALILAQAGLARLGLQDRISKVFTPEEMIPSGSQGILAVQGRSGEEHPYLDAFHSHSSQIVSLAERQFLTALSGGCSSPVAVYGQLNGDELLLSGMVVDADGSLAKAKVAGDSSRAQFLGDGLAKELAGRLKG